MNVKEIKTEVLIIGGGGAGLRAALESKKYVDDVSLISKNLCGKSGCTYLAAGGYACVFESSGTDDSVQAHFEDTMKGGCYINDRKLVRVLVSEAKERMLDLINFGVSLEKVGNKYLQKKAPGHTYPRICIFREKPGRDIVNALMSQVKTTGIRVFDRVMVTRLLTSNSKVIGAIGLGTSTGKFYVIKSKTTVIATGGGGTLFSRTTNPVDMTGDGFALAYQAGAELIDMEFVQFYPLVSIHPIKNILILPFVWEDGAHLLNYLNDRFLGKYESKWSEFFIRDLLSQAICLEVRSGRGIKGGVYLDFSKMPEDVLMDKYSEYLKIFLRKGRDIKKEPVIVGPSAHFFMGGIKINEKSQSSLEGLYAAGEVCGGVHGANRIAGNALTETQVFGARAGEFAAKEALFGEFVEPDSDQVEEEYDEIQSLLATRKGKKSLKDVRENLRRLMWDYVGVIRSGSELKEALRRIKAGREDDLPATFISDLKEAVRFIELQNMLTVSELICEAALVRKESRGAHYRIDYPERNEKWSKSITVQLNK